MRLLVHTCEILRKQKIEGKGLSAQYVSIATGVKCLALPSTPNDTLNMNLIVGKDYNVYCEPSTDVKEGDKLIVSTGVTLLVKGKADYKDLPNVSHIELACETLGE